VPRPTPAAGPGSCCHQIRQPRGGAPPDAPPPVGAGLIARKINGALALGTFKPRFRETSLAILDRHLIPFFGTRDARSIREADLLGYIRAKLDAGHKPATILNALSILRRVLNLAVRDGLVTHNPANGVGRLIARVARSEATAVPEVAAWTRAEVERLLRIAEEHEPAFAPLLRFFVSTGARRGEALGLRWEDVNFERACITIRRALTKGIAVT
jgi:integrase